MVQIFWLISFSLRWPCLFLRTNNVSWHFKNVAQSNCYINIVVVLLLAILFHLDFGQRTLWCWSQDGCQPGIQRHCRVLLQKGQLLGCYSYKSYLLHLALWQCPGNRTKMMPKDLCRACNLTAFIHSFTGLVGHPFVSLHEGPGFKSQRCLAKRL